MKINTFLAVSLLLCSVLLLGAKLENYPDVFLEDGQFTGELVIGEDAKAQDTIAMTYLAMDLQSSSVSTTLVCPGDDSETNYENATKIEQNSENLEIWKHLNDYVPVLDESNQPYLLEKGTFDDSEGEIDNEVAYEQEIQLVDSEIMANYVLSQDDDVGKQAGPYLAFEDKLYEYILDFEDPVEFTVGKASNDLESTTIVIQGQKYTITNVNEDSGHIEKMVLSGGNTAQWMIEGEEITKEAGGSNHTVKMLDVTTSSDACGLEIDGKAKWIDENDNIEVNNMTVAVLEAKSVHSKTYDSDVCRISLGEAEIVLEEGNEVKVNGHEIENSHVSFVLNGSGAAGMWQGMNISWGPDDLVYLSPDGKHAPEELIDPVFNRFKIRFDETVRTDDDLMHTSSSDNGEITFKNTAGTEIILPLVATDKHTGTAGKDSVLIGQGTAVDELYYYLSDEFDYQTCQASEVSDCEGARWIVESNKEATILELTDIDTDDKTVSFFDVTNNMAHENKDLTTVDNLGENNPVYIPGIGTIVVKVNATAIQLTNIGNVDNLESEQGAKLNLMPVNRTEDSAQGLSVRWVEEDMDFDTEIDIMSTGLPGMIDNVASNITIGTSVDSDEEIVFSTPDVKTAFYGTTPPNPPFDPGALGAVYTNQILPAYQAFWVHVNAQVADFSTDNEDVQVMGTFRGSIVGFNSEDNNMVFVTYPDEIAEADVYIMPTESNVIRTGETCYNKTKVYDISTSKVKFANEVNYPLTNDVIAVGGPCANSLTHKLLGEPENCAAGFESNKGLLKFVDDNSHVGLVVAGGVGEATQRIARELIAGGASGEQYSTHFSDIEKMDIASKQKVPKVEKPEPVTEPEEELSCPAGPNEKGEFDVKISKFAITKEITSHPEIQMDGTSGKLIFDSEEKFEAQLGVDWLEYDTHILKGGCDGESVKDMTFKWEDGDNYKEQSFSVPEKGCYCLKITNDDVEIDGANIEITSGDFTMDFATS